MNKKYTILINKITDARKKNNINWMNLLKVAIKHAPKQSKKILKILTNKKKISKLLKQITKN